MAVLWIAYDVRAPGSDDARLHAAIKSLGRWVRPIETLWFVETRQPAAAVRNTLKLYVDANTTLMVMPAAHGWAGLKVPQAVVSWLNAADY